MFNGDVFIVSPPPEPSWFSDVSQSCSLFFWEHSDLIPLLLAEFALAVVIFAVALWWERRKTNSKTAQVAELERMFFAPDPVSRPR